MGKRHSNAKTLRQITVPLPPPSAASGTETFIKKESKLKILSFKRAITKHKNYSIIGMVREA